MLSGCDGRKACTAAAAAFRPSVAINSLGADAEPVAPGVMHISRSSTVFLYFSQERLLPRRGESRASPICFLLAEVVSVRANG